MFGFLKSSPRHETWRRAYARCCQGVHRQFGLRTVPWLSYEAVGLYLASVDLGAIPRPADHWPICCRLRMGYDLRTGPDAAVLSYCSSAGLLLVDVKLEDDLRDSGPWSLRGGRARALKWPLHRATRRASAFLERAAPALPTQLRSCVGEHLELERRGVGVTLDETAEPTSRAFGLLFRGISGLLPGATPGMADALGRLGERIGSAIIRYDCAVDRETDERRGEFNPLRSAAEEELAIDDTLEDLTTAARDWRAIVGRESELARLFDHRIDSILAEGTGTSVECAARLERSGLARDRESVYLHVNPCALVEALDCCVGLADCLSCLAPRRHGGCLHDCGAGHTGCCCSPIDDLCCSTSNVTGGDEDATGSPLIGMTGKCITSLKPQGTIRIGGVRRRAETKGEHLPKGTKVVVIAAESFGLLVRQAD